MKSGTLRRVELEPLLGSCVEAIGLLKAISFAHRTNEPIALLVDVECKNVYYPHLWIRTKLPFPRESVGGVILVRGRVSSYVKRTSKDVYLSYSLEKCDFLKETQENDATG